MVRLPNTLTIRRDKLYNPFTPTRLTHELQPVRDVLAAAGAFHHYSSQAVNSDQFMGARCPACFGRSTSMLSSRYLASIGPAVDESILIHQPTVRKVPFDQDSINSRSPCQLRLRHPQGKRHPGSAEFGALTSGILFFTTASLTKVSFKAIAPSPGVHLNYSYPIPTSPIAGFRNPTKRMLHQGFDDTSPAFFC